MAWVPVDTVCVSYRKLNQVTDGVQDIDTEENYFIVVYMYSGHRNVVAE